MLTRIMLRRFLFPTLVCVATIACERQRATLEAAPSASAEPATDEAPRPAQGATETSIAGRVVEKLDVTSYSYLLIDTRKEKVWTAVPSSTTKVGDSVRVERAILMRAYRSAALRRDFDRVYFGTLRTSGAAAGAHGAASPGPSADSKIPSKVARAPGNNGRTVAEVVVNAKELVGKRVTVRAAVVKVNPRILGKTWVHLRDGSGSERDRSHDLTATLPEGELPKLGEVVLVHGTIATDKDVGAGYRYPVLLEGDRVERD